MTGSGQRELALIGCVTSVVGAFLPWVTVTTVFGSVSRNGIDTADGKGVAVLGLVAAATVYSGQVNVARIIGGVIALVGIFNLVDIERLADEPAAKVGSGFGLWMVVVGAVIVVAQPQLRKPTDPAQPSLPPPPG